MIMSIMVSFVTGETILSSLLEMNSRVPADRVRAVTVSKMGNEFIMHVPDGVDCRYDHPDK